MIICDTDFFLILTDLIYSLNLSTIRSKLMPYLVFNKYRHKERFLSEQFY